MFVTINAAYGAQFCGNGCYEEFEWRKTLSILGKEYYLKGESGNIKK